MREKTVEHSDGMLETHIQCETCLQYFPNRTHRKHESRCKHQKHHARKKTAKKLLKKGDRYVQPELF